MTKRILIIGAGTAGQVFGLHLARGGADVAVLVRPRHRQEAERGYALHHVRPTGKRRHAALRPVEVLTSADEVARAARFDQAWLCVATTALADTAWLADVAAATAPATLVSFQPGLGVRADLERVASAERIAQGAIAFVAWASPLEGSRDPRELGASPPGVAYFLPPLERIVISGASERRALDVVAALRDGGLRADLVGDAEAELAFATAVLMPTIAALELAGWSFAAFRAGDHAERAARGAAEAIAVASRETGRAPPLATPLLSGPLLSLGAWVAPAVAPFDVETYLRVHFTKVGAQTRLLLGSYVDRAIGAGLGHAALDDLLGRLEARG